ncbi:MAG: sulfatase, partial [Opitutales bacterium]|nr:sulfatase [Opitutales bacterium]
MIRKHPFLITAIAASLHLFPHATAANHSDRPNILFIIADDQSPFDLKTYDPNSPLETPTINRLSAEGMTFD